MITRATPIVWRDGDLGSVRLPFDSLLFVLFSCFFFLLLLSTAHAHPNVVALRAIADHRQQLFQFLGDGQRDPEGNARHTGTWPRSRARKGPMASTKRQVFPTLRGARMSSPRGRRRRRNCYRFRVAFGAKALMTLPHLHLTKATAAFRTSWAGSMSASLGASQVLKHHARSSSGSPQPVIAGVACVA